MSWLEEFIDALTGQSDGVGGQVATLGPSYPIQPLLPAPAAVSVPSAPVGTFTIDDVPHDLIPAVPPQDTAMPTIPTPAAPVPASALNTVTRHSLTLTEQDIALAARKLGVEPAALHAVADVESSGAGFLPDGRPKILFEAHIFHRLTGGKFDGKRDRHGVLLSVPVWNRALYGAAGAHQYERHDDAAKLDADAADKSCSWGTFQVMGMNSSACGFNSVNDFVAAMESGAAAHLDALCEFLKATHLVTDLERGEWSSFARGYNGPGQVSVYAARLASAYARHAPQMAA